MNILLVYSEFSEQESVEGRISSVAGWSYVVSSSVSQALSILKQDGNIDLILMGLLPENFQNDSDFLNLLSYASSVPFIVVSRDDDDETARLLIQRGVQEVIPSTNLRSVHLTRIITFASERHCYQRDRDALLLAGERLSFAATHRVENSPHDSDTTQVTSSSFGILPLKERQPKEFEELVRGYVKILEKSLQIELSSQPREPVAATAHIRELAERFGYEFASPRDIIEVHTLALRSMAKTSPHEALSTLNAESRMILIELMGSVVTFYRKYALPAVRT